MIACKIILDKRKKETKSREQVSQFFLGHGMCYTKKRITMLVNTNTILIKFNKYTIENQNENNFLVDDH